MSFDVAILGSGVIGACAAFHLAEGGRKVLWVSDGEAGATHAAAGMLSPSFELAHDAGGPKLRALLELGLESWRGFAARLSDEPAGDIGFQLGGVYGIGFHARPPGSELPDRGALREFSQKPSAFVPGEGSVEPLLLLQHIKRRAADVGITIVEGRGEVAEGGVRVAGETFSVQNVVLATGAAREQGPEGLMGVKGAAFIVRLHPDDAGAVPGVVRSPTAYFVPRQDGTLYIGATEEWPGAIAAGPDDLWSDAVRLLPCLGRAERLRRLEGFRPFIDRSGPLIERDGGRLGLIRAQGHHRNGVLLGPVSAEAIEELLV
ncbi:NAD(P)/FAD-dependent oxidoreductase [Parvularcula mediterranea]|uniref:NAD(P)/FAD-dependent oxidoreductase n=1 Tax=Parvularcula mediterranea TaxID=2732508 RepID=UPI001E61B2C5|nr:FAD-dependent oxidoreductase [Parvularcula mediterranea]